MSKKSHKGKENKDKDSKQRLSHHDRFTRSMMAHPKVIEEFFAHHLPAKIRESIDFASIELQKDSFIDDKLNLQVADLLYSVKYNGEPGYLYLLLEHASTPSKLLPFRMLKYMVAIMDEHLKKVKGTQLPFIYPLILYSSKEGTYPYSMDLFDLFAANEKELAKEVMVSPYQLLDLTQQSDQELEKYLWFGTMALALKHIHDSDILPFLKGILKVLKKLEEQGEEGYIHTVISYVVKAGNVSNKETFSDTIQELETTEKGKYMKLIDLLEPIIYQRGLEKGEQKGLEKGKQEGLTEGEQRGLKEGQKKLAQKLIERGIDIDVLVETTPFSKEELLALMKIK